MIAAFTIGVLGFDRRGMRWLEMEMFSCGEIGWVREGFLFETLEFARAGEGLGFYWLSAELVGLASGREHAGEAAAGGSRGIGADVFVARFFADFEAFGKDFAE